MEIATKLARILHGEGLQPVRSAIRAAFEAVLVHAEVDIEFQIGLEPTRRSS